MSQEVFGGMTTVSLGFTRGSDEVGKTGSPEFADYAKHWQYRLGLTQILTPRWLASLNFEAVVRRRLPRQPLSRRARVRCHRAGAQPAHALEPRDQAARDRRPRSARRRGARRVPLLLGHLGHQGAHTLEVGYSRYFGERWLADAYARYYTQSNALFYSDNATAETLYISRNRQLGTFNNTGLGAKLAYTYKPVRPASTRSRPTAATSCCASTTATSPTCAPASPTRFNAHVLQLLVTATF